MNAYVNNATIPTHNVDTDTVGIQNKSIRRILFPNRLAAKKNAKNNIARIQNRGEKIFSPSPLRPRPSPLPSAH
jgi:hypothetical protein